MENSNHNLKDKVLVVEDNFNQQKMMKSILSKLDIDIVLAGSGQKALSAMLRDEFALALVDIKMPEMNGFELANLMKNNTQTQDIPIIFMTAYSQDELKIIEGYELGAIDFLFKPINELILISKVKMFLRYINIHREKEREKVNTEMIQKLEENNRKLERFNVSILNMMEDANESAEQMKLKEKDLIKSRKKAESASIHKNQFLANMSHEIRTPMNAVVGFSDLLKNDNLSHQIRHRYLDIIDTNSKQLLNLIDDIIDVAKIESNELKISIKNCHLAKIFEELEMSFNQIKSNRNKDQLHFKAHIPAKYKNLQIRTDCSRLSQVISNLLNNALKFTENGNIDFGFKIRNDKVYFYVKDEGIGIPEDKMELIFERFKQVNYDNNAAYGGTGLGLAICRGIVQLLGGEIKATSELGVGTEIKFTIPLEEPEIKTEKAVQKTINPDSLDNKTILIAEDEESIRYYFETIFEKTNVKLIFAENGYQAIEKFKKHKEINIVLMDIRMPVKNGFDALKEIISINPKAKVIMQTAFVNEEEKIKSIKLGAIDYLIKPIQKNVLFETIVKWINKS